MPDDLPENYRTISLAAEEKHQNLRNEFANLWKLGHAPRIEDWLEKVPEDERPALFFHLAKLERQLRQDDVIVDEFRNRFPRFGSWIDTVFRDDTNNAGSAAADMSFPTIPGYQIHNRIAYGGMGVVYKAMQLGLDRLVALKMVRGGRWIKDDELIRFKSEARAVAGLDHPHIVRIYDFGEFEGLPYFTMEYVEGGSLSQKLIAEPMGFRESANLIEMIARAIQLVHDRQLVHRDLKPGNILLTKDLAPKISDFGLAKRLGTDLSVTITGTVMGTASYMAPEQARGDKHVGPAVDIYALGAILYECLTGQPPFRDETYEKTIRRVIDEEPKRPRELLSLIPPELEAICLKCLEKDPAERYATALDVARDIRCFLNGEPLSIGLFDVVDQHTRWARKLNLDSLEMLGCTQWAFVYKARETIINRQVILKICTGQVSSTAHGRLRRQAEAMAGLGHPNLEQLYVYGEHNGQPYLVQEFVEGRNFSAVMRERIIEPDAKDLSIANDPSAEVAMVRLPARKAFVPVTATLAAEWIKMLARALQFMHEQGVLHSAIYPGEIRLTGDGVPKLCGFGAAQKVNAGKGAGEASASWVRPNYQPPEQIDARWTLLCAASDVYSLGAVLYELLTGHAPFFGLSIEETRAAVRKEIPIAARNLNPRIPPFLDWMCQRCLAKNPADRFGSAGEMADELDRFLRGQSAKDDETANIEPELAAEVATGDFELHIYHKSQNTPAIFPLPRRWIAIGRATESDIVVQDDYCSRNHCAIYWDDKTNQHVLILIKAKHGVRINGELVRGCQSLIPGDIIQVATTRIVFEQKQQVR